MSAELCSAAAITLQSTEAHLEAMQRSQGPNKLLRVSGADLRGRSQGPNKQSAHGRASGRGLQPVMLRTRRSKEAILVMALSCEQQGTADCCIVDFCAASEDVLWIGIHAGKDERLAVVM